MVPTSLIDSFKRVPGIADISPVLAFIGYYQRPNQVIQAYGYFPGEIPQILPAMQVAPNAVQAFRATRDAILVSDDVMGRYGWKIGDRIPLMSGMWLNRSGGRRWDFAIVGTFKAPSSLLLRSSLLFNYDYLDERPTIGQGGMTNSIIVRVSDPAKAAQVAAALDAITRNSPYETKTEPESQHTRDSAQQIGDVGLLVDSIVGAVFFTLLFSVGGVMAEAIRERTKDIGILKAVGFTDLSALALVLAEATLVCVSGAVAGLIIAQWLFPTAAQLTGFVAVEQGPVFIDAIVVAIALAWVSAGPAALRALRLPVTEALADRT